MAFARAVQGSNSIEGYNASLDDVVAAVEEEPTLGAEEETQQALAGYRDAMTYVLQIADDESLEVDEGLLKSLHFMMLKYDLKKNPGRWRPGPIFVHREATDEIVYEGPPERGGPRADRRDAAGSWTATTDPVVVKAAMAHLNLTMIHPFSDGNGRMARCLQTLRPGPRASHRPRLLQHRGVPGSEHRGLLPRARGRRRRRLAPRA